MLYKHFIVNTGWMLNPFTIFTISFLLDTFCIFLSISSLHKA